LLKLITAKKPTRPDRGKPAVLPGAVLWVGMLLCILAGNPTQLAVWEMLRAHFSLFGLTSFSLSPQAIYQRLAKNKPLAIQELFGQVSSLLALHYPYLADDLAGIAAFAHTIVALDQTKLDPMLRRTKILRVVKKGDDKLLPGSLNCVFDVRRQQFLSVKYVEDPKENEKKQARASIDGLKIGTLILADMGYFSFPWFDDLTHAGLYFISRVREKTSYSELRVLYDGIVCGAHVTDRIVYLGAYRADKAGCPVRLVEVTIPSTTGSENTQTFRYITNVMDRRKLSVSDMIQLYRRRWDIEQVFNLLKTHLGMSLLCSSQINTMLAQVYATFTIAQIVLAMRTEIARRAEADVLEVSLALLVRHIPRYIAIGQNPIDMFVAHGNDLGYIRAYRGKYYDLPDVDPGDYNLPEAPYPEREPRYAGRRCAARKTPRKTAPEPAPT
jgi:hypothetical protein